MRLQGASDRRRFKVVTTCRGNDTLFVEPLRVLQHFKTLVTTFSNKLGIKGAASPDL